MLRLKLLEIAGNVLPDFDHRRKVFDDLTVKQDQGRAFSI